MCGIVGLFTYKFNKPELDLRVKAIVQRMLFTESLVHMESRGRDSTGIALLWDDHETAIVKQPVAAHQFAKEDGCWGDDHQNPDDPDANFRWLMDKWMREHPKVQIKQALGHVRAGTKGSEYNPHNNHPLIVSDQEFGKGGPINGNMTIGVHNGGIRNDDHIEKNHDFTRVGEVDSEVIFQLINEYNEDYNIENLQKTFDELAGAYAVMAYNPAILNKVACMRETRPLNAAFIPQLGTLVLISERDYLNKSIEEYERWRIRESGHTYTYIDEQGEVQDLGSVYDNFPYLSADWYDTTISDTVESGVFVLDLDTEVTAETKAKDLVEVKRIYTRAGSSTNKTTTTTPTTGSRSGGTNLGTDKRSASGVTGISTTGTTTSPTPKDDARAEGKETKDGIIDFTDYSDTGAGRPTSDPNIIDVEATATEDVLEVDMAALVGEDDAEEEDDDCPYTWKERTEMAMDSLYSSASQLGDKLTLSRVNEDGIQGLLENYLVKTKNPDEAATILASFYDIIFPEGFALGYGDGYDSALVDMENNSGGEENLDDELETEVEEMKKTAAMREAAITNLTGSLQKAKTKKNKAQRYIRIMRPLLSHLLMKEGVVDKDGNVNDGKLEVLKKDAGMESRPNLARTIETRVMNKGR